MSTKTNSTKRGFRRKKFRQKKSSANLLFGEKIFDENAFDQFFFDEMSGNLCNLLKPYAKYFLFRICDICTATVNRVFQSERVILVWFGSRLIENQFDQQSPEKY